jgi:hypothetical protein
MMKIETAKRESVVIAEGLMRVFPDQFIFEAGAR